MMTMETEAQLHGGRAMSVFTSWIDEDQRAIRIRFTGGWCLNEIRHASTQVRGMLTYQNQPVTVIFEVSSAGAACDRLPQSSEVKLEGLFEHPLVKNYAMVNDGGIFNTPSSLYNLLTDLFTLEHAYNVQEALERTARRGPMLA